MFENMTYEKALPRLYGMMEYLSIKDPKGELYGKVFLEERLESAQGSFLTDIPKHQKTKLWRKNRCVYCQTSELPENTEGDHPVPKDKEVDLDAYVIPCCTKCNSKKKRKSLLDWWVGELKK